ncbi:MAG TPA: c-type cytochrome [Chitinophagaceae bacterium]|nr:c-type cytochrome [Chitinophagaceae bacterium]
MKKLLKVLGILLLVVLVAVVGVAAYVKLALPDVGPAPDIKVTSTADAIQRGSYLANNVMLCMDCHSTRDWSKFSGPLVDGTLGKGGEIFDKRAGFPGTYYSANITPAGLTDWTDGELFRAITTGVRKNGKPIFPVMPHHNYGLLDEQDIKAVIAYLRTLPAIENKVPESESDFPMNFIINTIPAKAKLAPRPPKSDSVAYGKYMATAASCGDCHTPFEKGSLVMEQFMGGGRRFDMPWGTLISSNISPDPETGIGNWTREAFLNRFRVYRDSAAAHQTVSGPTEFNTIMPWTMYAGMTDEDLSAIYTYIKTLKPVKNKVVKFTPATASAKP